MKLSFITLLGMLATLLKSVTCFDLTILHTNDFHSRVQEINKYGGSCSVKDSEEGNCFGGSARIKTMVESKRQNYPDNTILLSGGDQFQGTVWFSTFGGGVLAKFMNLIGYDAMSLGNHEFDNGVDGLKKFLDVANFSVLASNLDLDNTPALEYSFPLAKSTVLEVGGEQIGVIGYVTQETSVLSNSGSVTFLDELTSIQSEVDILKSQGINKIIAVGHAGFTKDKELTRGLTDVDIIVGGHSNTFLYTGESPSNEAPEEIYPYVENGVLIVQDYAYGKYLGELHVTFNEEGVVTGHSGNPVLLDSSVEKDPEVLDLISEYLPELEALESQVIGETYVLLDHEICRAQECNLGNLVADAMVKHRLRWSGTSQWSEVAIAFMNGGGLRTAIAQGPINQGQMISLLPFRNTIDVIEVTGATILEMLEHSVSRYEEHFGGFLQVSGLQVTYDLDKDPGERVASVLAVCSECEVPKLQPLQSDQTYKIILPNFIKEGGDYYSFIKPNIISDELAGDLIYDIALDYINTTSPIYLGLQSRIQFLKDLKELSSVQAVCESLNSSRAQEPFCVLYCLIALFVLLMYHVS